MSHRHRPKFTGLFHDDIVTDSYWIRESGRLTLPPLAGIKQLTIQGEILPASPTDPTSAGVLGLQINLDGRRVLSTGSLNPGPFSLPIDLPAASSPAAHHLSLRPTGVTWSNLRAWLGRITGLRPWQPWRLQARNRRLRIQRIKAGDEVLFDFANRAAPWNVSFARRFLKLGLNIVGYFRADLGVGESVRCMARAAQASQLPHALVDLKLPCKNPQSDNTFLARLQPDNPHPVNVFHLDAPGARDLDYHHGKAFRRDKYNIGYWAWELPDFPDSWIHFADYFDEIWTPSRFTTDAIAQKVPLPVLTMPHAISFERPQGEFREKFGLPAGKFLFLFLYDLNSYSERKNPAAAIESFRRSGLAGRNAALVIKVHNVAANPADFARLREAVAALPGTILITETLQRREIYELETACDCFVSLHRSEGYGLAIAECMYLGKPVISTDWSGSAELIDPTNGCPVRYTLMTLDRNHGPYAKGQTWAEPDLDHAAKWMQQLCSDPALGQSIGTAARNTIEEKFSPAAIGGRYRRRLEAIAGW